jgi:hypothetical protein
MTVRDGLYCVRARDGGDWTVYRLSGGRASREWGKAEYLDGADANPYAFVCRTLHGAEFDAVAAVLAAWITTDTHTICHMHP